MGESAFEDEASDPVGIAIDQFQCRSATQRAPHDDQRPGIPLLVQPVGDEAENDVAVGQQGRGSRSAGGAAITPIIDRDEIDSTLHIQGANVVVILDDFAVAVKEQDVGRCGIGQMAARSDLHSLRHGNRQIADVIRGIPSKAGARIKQIGNDFRPVERPIIGRQVGDHERVSSAGFGLVDGKFWYIVQQYRFRETNPNDLR